MSKEEFVEAINSLKEQRQIDDNFYKHMCLAFPGSYSPIYKNVLWELSIKILSIAMKDSSKFIEWWVFESDFGEKTDIADSLEFNGKNYPVRTAECLYDFLVFIEKDNLINDGDSKK